MMKRIITTLLLTATLATAQGVWMRTDTVVDGGHRLDVDTNGKHTLVDASLTNDLVLMQTMSYDDTGTYYDVSPAGNDGTQTTANFRPTILTNYGGVASFDGTDDGIDVAGRIVGGYPFTHSAWLKGSSNSSQVITWLGDTSVDNVNYLIYVNGSGNMSTITRNTTLIIDSTTTTITDNQWHYVVAVWTSATVRSLYVDGILRGSGSTSVTYSGTVDGYSLGYPNDATPSAWYTGVSGR